MSVHPIQHAAPNCKSIIRFVILPVFPDILNLYNFLVVSLCTRRMRQTSIRHVRCWQASTIALTNKNNRKCLSNDHTVGGNCLEQRYSNAVFFLDTGKAHYRHKYTPLPLNGLIKTVSLAADDSMESAITLIKMLKALHLPAESHYHYCFLQHFCSALLYLCRWCLNLHLPILITRNVLFQPCYTGLSVL